MAGANGKGVFFGVAVAEYEDPNWVRLDGALAAMRELGALMEKYGFHIHTVESPTRQELFAKQDDLVGLDRDRSKEPLVLVWTGHAEALGTSLGLILKDTPSSGSGKRDNAYAPSSLVSLLFEIGASNSLIVIDSCSAGAADQEMFITNLREADQASWAGAKPGLACIASCSTYEKAEQGAFLTELLTLLRDGPEDLGEAGPFQIMYSSNSDTVALAAIRHVLKARGDGEEVRPHTWESEASSISFPNPLFAPREGGAFVDDQLREMSGQQKRPSLLVQTPAMVALSERIREDSPGLWMLVGGPGIGKSSCLEYVHGEHGEQRLHLLLAQSGVDALAAAVAAARDGVAIALDALDEAPVAQQAAIAELATGWARERLVIVSSRLASAFADDARNAAADLANQATEVIDLDDARWRGDAIFQYVRRRLAGEDEDEA